MRLNKLAILAMSFSATAAVQAGTVSAVAGWNLLGYGDAANVVVADAFGNPGNVVTVWKWNAVTSMWAFYSPALSDGGQAYAASKNYEFLTTLKSGDGFWVNAKAPFGATLPAAPAQVVNPEALAGISATLKTFENLFATALPAASDPTLGNLLDASLLSGGSNKMAFLQQMLSGNGPNIGGKFINIALVLPTDSGAVANDATHQWFTFADSSGGGPGSAWLAIKNGAGNWLLAGDQRMFGFNVELQAVKQIQNATTSPQISYRNQLNLNIDSNISTGVVSAVEVSGPGVLPATGALIYSAAQGSIWLNTCGNNQATTSCVDITQVTAGAKYTFKGYTTAGGTVPTYTYANVLPTSPLSGAALAAAAFPSITSVSGSWAPNSSVTVNWTLPAGTQANWLDLGAWQNQGGNLFNNVGTRLMGSSTSATLTLPNYSGTIAGKNVWLNTRDASGNSLALEFQP